MAGSCLACLEDEDAAAEEADGGEEDVVVAGDLRADGADLVKQDASPYEGDAEHRPGAKVHVDEGDGMAGPEGGPRRGAGSRGAEGRDLGRGGAGQGAPDLHGNKRKRRVSSRHSSFRPG